MLKVIDISSHQSVETAGIDGIDAVIVKATQGTGYINPKCDAQYQLAKKKGRLLGVYHYAGGGDPVAGQTTSSRTSKVIFTKLYSAWIGKLDKTPHGETLLGVVLSSTAYSRRLGFGV